MSGRNFMESSVLLPSHKDDNNHMISKIRVFFSIIAFLLAAIGCQEDLTEINSPVEATISSDSDLSSLISFATLKDGSYDNIIDNTSALSIKLPIDVVANGESVSIATEGDFETLESIFKKERYVADSIQIIYPISAYQSDYSEIILESDSDLQAIVEQSIEGGEDDDIECYRFNYPVSVSIYDTQNQRAKTELAKTDQEFYQIFNSLESDDLTSLSYPISLKSNQGETMQVSTNLELETLLSSAISLCDEEDEKYYKTENFSFTTSSLRIELTDAPFPFDFVSEANIKIDQLQLRQVADSNEEATFFILSEEEMSFNLLTLTNGLTATLVDLQIPEGSYDQIRMIVSESSVVLTDGRIFDLKIPSGAQSGIKIHLPSDLEIIEGQDSDLLLDFDVSKSFKVQGNSKDISKINGFIFTPSIKATEPNKSGQLKGTVTDLSSTMGLEGAQLSVYAADTLNTTTFADEEGNYTVLGLTPGTYSVTTEANDYLIETKDDIEISIGETTILDFELTLE